MIQLNEYSGPETEPDERRTAVDALCVEVLGALGEYAERHHFSLDGTRAVIFRSSPRVSINMIIPSTVPVNHRAGLEQVACGKAECNTLNPRLNFIYGRTVY